ncbi:MAG TPA: FAD-binding oxidoreductase [Microthrixaceae bacterium]|nr:FAD-binding oxidoreductase [Microthrixaceae bacterium]HMT23787.1 FAD-binding oxidoreductase [Microthrixaceae bacterium]
MSAESTAASPRRSHRLLRGWGRTAPTAADVIGMLDVEQIRRAVHDSPRGVLGRGLGRSYGDGAQNAGGVIVDGTTAVGIIEFDPDAGRVTAKAGTSLDQLMEWLVPMGWFVPVTPGTRQVTVGGAIAADIHGKNHHQAGSWCNHVESFRLLVGSGEVLDVHSDRSPDLFWATAGGMGLTGVVLDATFRCKAIETSRLVVDTDRAADLDAVMALMVEGDADYDYSVAWIDIMTRGAAMGRSVLDRGRFARLDELPSKFAPDPLRFVSNSLGSLPPIAPSGLINPLTVRAFNELWFRKAPARRRDAIMSITQFFHPLDLVEEWNRVYGPKGFLQWQYVVPDSAGEVVRSTLEQLSAAGVPSFLAVLKRMGPGNAGHLSFPSAGWTLAFDAPVGGAELGPLLDRLDEQVVEAGGRIYLAKDSRVRREHIPAMYPRLDDWREIRAKADPDGRFRSDLGRRLGLI